MTNFATILTRTALVLLGLSFFGCDRPAESPASTAQTPAPATDSGTGLNIVFVKVDSLQAGYTAVAEELSRLETNYNEAEKNHQNRVTAFQREVQKLQKQAQQGLLAPNKMQAEQQRLAQKEQEIMQQQQLAIQSIQQNQLEIQQRFSLRVKEVLEQIQEENHYDYILNQGQNSAVLITNDAYDITAMVLERLNAADAAAEVVE